MKPSIIHYVNQFDSACQLCHEDVPSTSGYACKIGGKWFTYCRPCIKLSVPARCAPRCKKVFDRGGEHRKHYRLYLCNSCNRRVAWRYTEKAGWVLHDIEPWNNSIQVSERTHHCA